MSYRQDPATGEFEFWGAIAGLVREIQEWHQEDILADPLLASTPFGEFACYTVVFALEIWHSPEVRRHVGSGVLGSSRLRKFDTFVTGTPGDIRVDFAEILEAVLKYGGVERRHVTEWRGNIISKAHGATASA